MKAMCYSAMVKQSVKKLALQYQARIQLDAFEALFTQRLQGSGAKIPRAMELSFSEPENAQEKRIWKLIQQFEHEQRAEAEASLFSLKKRIAEAEQKLKIKETKTAKKELRIGQDKLEKVKSKLKHLGDTDPRDCRVEIAIERRENSAKKCTPACFGWSTFF